MQLMLVNVDVGVAQYSTVAGKFFLTSLQVAINGGLPWLMPISEMYRYFLDEV